MTAAQVKFGNLWRGPFFELQIAFFSKESCQKLVRLGNYVFLKS